MGMPACQSMCAHVPPYPLRDEPGVNPQWRSMRPFIGLAHVPDNVTDDVMT